MGQISNLTNSQQPNSASINSRLPQNAVLEIRAALGSAWKGLGTVVGTVTDECMCRELSKAAGSANNKQPDWEADILSPMLKSISATYESANVDANDFTQTVAIVHLAYGIIRQRNAAPTQADYNFIASTFDKFLTLDDLVAIKEIVEAENEQCSGENNDLGKANVLFILEAQLQEAILRTELPDEASPEVTLVDTKSLDDTDTLALPRTQTIVSRYVHVQYYIKPSCVIEVNCVIVIDTGASINSPKEVLFLKTSDGRRMDIEEGVIVNKVESKPRTVEIRAPMADGFELSATVIIPPGKSHFIHDVISIDRIDEAVDWTVFETPQATVWVGNKGSMSEPVGGSVEIKNLLECLSDKSNGSEITSETKTF